MRRKLYGENAQNTMLGFDKRQADAIRQGAPGLKRTLPALGGCAVSWRERLHPTAGRAPMRLIATPTSR